VVGREEDREGVLGGGVSGVSLDQLSLSRSRVRHRRDARGCGSHMISDCRATARRTERTD
jgi:hypothetical protein